MGHSSWAAGEQAGNVRVPAHGVYVPRVRRGYRLVEAPQAGRTVSFWGAVPSRGSTTGCIAFIVSRVSVENEILRIIMEEQLRLPHPVIRSNNLDTCRGARVRLSPKLRSEEGEAAWQKAVSAPDAMVAVDLFCGAGGLSYGFQEAGFVTALGIDSNADACETHAANLLSRTLCQDIRTIKHPQALVEELGIPRVDIVIGGPPCQGLSCLRR